MRSALLCTLFLAACGRPLLTPPPAEPLAEPTRVRLNSNFEASDGFRFSDRTILNSRTFLQGGEVVTEIRTPDGSVVQGDAARTELQSNSGRYFVVQPPEGQLCVTAPATSLAEVDESTCSEWKRAELLHLSFQPGSTAAGMGLIVRTNADQAWRVWIVESGFDEAAQRDTLLFEFEARPSPAACVSESGCVVSDDCCIRRHTCTAGVCQY